MNYQLIKNIEIKEIELNNEKQKIPNHWQKTNVKESIYLKARIGWQGLKNSEFIKEGVFYCVTGQDFYKNSVDWNKCYKVLKERYDQDLKIQLKNGDILITKDGTIGKIAKTNNIPDGYKATLNSGVFVSRANNILQNYWYYILKSEVFNKFVLKQKSGSTIAHLNQGKFEELEFLQPSENEQLAISSILSKQEVIISNIEKLIEKNKLIFNELSNKLLSGEFRLKNDNGKVSIYKNNEDNWKTIEVNGEMKDIPIDWNVEKLQKHILVINGYAFPKSQMLNEKTNTSCPIIKIGNIQGENIIENSGTGQNYYNGIVKDLFVPQFNDLIIGLSGANAGKTGIYKLTNKTVLNQRNAIVRIKSKAISQEFFNFFWFKDALEVLKETTKDSAIPNISSDDIESIDVFILSKFEQDEIINILNKEKQLISKQTKLLDKEKEKFEWLLDNLLSGNYLVKEI